MSVNQITSESPNRNQTEGVFSENTETLFLELRSFITPFNTHSNELDDINDNVIQHDSDSTDNLNSALSSESDSLNYLNETLGFKDDTEKSALESLIISSTGYPSGAPQEVLDFLSANAGLAYFIDELGDLTMADLSVELGTVLRSTVADRYVAPSFLLCDGSSFNGTTYSALSALLGGTVTPDLTASSGIHKYYIRTGL